MRPKRAGHNLMVYSHVFRFSCIKQKRYPEQPILGLMADESAELTENDNLGSGLGPYAV